MSTCHTTVVVVVERCPLHRRAGSVVGTPVMSRRP